MKKYLRDLSRHSRRPREVEEAGRSDAQAARAAGHEGLERLGREAQGAIVDMGSPLGKTKRADARGISDTSNAMAAYTIVQAESHEAAAKIFENHPHFTIFPGEAIEIMECLPIPGQ